MRYTFIDYDNHAVQRLATREFDEETVRTAIEQPSVRYRSHKHPDRIIVERRTAEGPALRVIYVERSDARGDGVLVITLYPIRSTRMGRG